MKTIIATCLFFVLAGCVAAGEASFSTPPSFSKNGETYTVSFAVAAKTDVEVAILDSAGEPVRHLAAGVLGDGKVTPPLKAGLTQSLEWDGKDDFGKPAQKGPFTARVRAGIQANFGRFVGGDPYRFGAINGVATDEDNNLYVSAFHGETNQNMIVVRKYAPDGKYLATLLPFSAACKPGTLPKVAEWDEKRKTFVPNNLQSLNPAFYPWSSAEANLVSASKAGVVVVSGRTTSRFGQNGEVLSPPVPMWSDAAKLECPNWLTTQIAASPDGKYLYYSNVAGTKYQPKHFNDTNPNWPQGRVYRQDVTKPGTNPEKFYDLELPDWEKEKYWLPDAWNKRTAACGICTDAKGNLYICDLVNQAIVEVDPIGKKVSSTKAPWPERVVVDPKSGDYYVVSRLDKPKDGTVLKKLIKISGRGDNAKTVAELPLKTAGLGNAIALGNNGGPVLWIAGGLEMLCVKDTGAALTPVETAFKPEPESQTEYNRIAVDWARDHVYVNTGTNRVWRYDGMTGKGELLKEKGKTFYITDLSVGYDGLLYIRSGEGYSGPFERRTHTLEPAPFGSSQSCVLTPYVYSRMGVGFSEHGIGVGPDAKSYFIYMYDWNKYCVSGFNGDGTAIKGKFLKGKINLPGKDGKYAMPKEVDSAVVGPLPMSNGGLRVDLQGNIYVGMRLMPDQIQFPENYDKSAAYKHWTGAVVKFPPDGGTIQNTETKDDQVADSGSKLSVNWASSHKMTVVGALHIYPGVGSFSGGGWGGNGSSCVCRVPRFDIDRYGRLVLPNVVTNTVSIIDNAGNEVITFGAYGNFDSQYVAPGAKDAKPALDAPQIPLAWPTGAGFSKNHVYVNDTYNRRVVRVDFKYAAEAKVPVK